MLSKERLLDISKTLFLLLVFFIPVNLGKHFEIIDSYVRGVLIDYLVPTIFLQDILVFIILMFWLFSFTKNTWYKILNILDRKEIQMIVLFVFSVLLSSLCSQRIVPSLYAWSRFFLYFLLFLYILLEIPVEEYFFKILKIIAISIIFSGLLGIFQYINKGSVFNNYLVLGEQPYSYSTYGIAKEIFLGTRVIPSYGLFRHPNIFGGYLSLLLLWIFPFIKKNLLYLISFLLGTVVLFFTFSYTSWFAFILGIFLTYVFSLNPQKIKKRKKIIVFLISIFCVVLTIVPFGDYYLKSTNQSILRRSNFNKASFRMIKDFPFFGVGLNNSTVLMDDYNYESRDIRFIQPVHNIFLLIFSETGVLSFLLFLSFLYITAKKLINSSYFHLFLISFLQIIILGSFDHYLITIHQTLLLFWIVFGLALQ